MPINNPARLLTSYKTQRELQSRMDSGIQIIEDFSKETRFLRDNNLQSFLKYSIDVLTCLRSREDMYIKACEYAITKAGNSPLASLILKFYESGFNLWFLALKASGDSFPLIEAITTANDICDRLAPVYEKALIDHHFNPAKMGQGIISHTVLNHDTYSRLPTPERNRLIQDLSQKGKSLVKALEFLIVAGVETVTILPQLEKEIVALKERTEESDAFSRIFSRSAAQCLDLLELSIKVTNIDSKLGNLIKLRNQWANWANVLPAETDVSYFLNIARSTE